MSDTVDKPESTEPAKAPEVEDAPSDVGVMYKRPLTQTEADYLQKKNRTQAWKEILLAIITSISAWLALAINAIGG